MLETTTRPEWRLAVDICNPFPSRCSRRVAELGAFAANRTSSLDPCSRPLPAAASTAPQGSAALADRTAHVSTRNVAATKVDGMNESVFGTSHGRLLSS